MKLRLPEEGEDLKQYLHFDNTKLTAVNTCPKWGIIRYGQHKTFSNSARAMALEAGEACHQVFAGARLFDLYHNGHIVYPHEPHKDLAVARCVELFGEERTERYFKLITNQEDERTRILQGGIYLLESSGFYDDPTDKQRTVDTLTEACIAYLDRYSFGKHIPYIRGDFVGVENAFAVIAEWDDGLTVVFTGRIDGMHCYRNDHDKPFIEDNKTSSRLSDAWELSFETSHQITGYLAAASTIIGHLVDRAKVHGLQIPQPKVYSDGVVEVDLTREGHHFDSWGKWFRHTVDLYMSYFNDPASAPMYTHSCNRYFRPCSFIPLCVTPIEEQRTIIEEEMVVEEWSPLHDKAGD